eukprot:COSAG03_NODE_183_length_10952_cov_150.888694_12_plen_78_part_00
MGGIRPYAPHQWRKGCQQKGHTKEHKAAVDVKKKMCKDCGQRQPAFAPRGQGQTVAHVSQIGTYKRGIEGANQPQAH